MIDAKASRIFSGILFQKISHRQAYIFILFFWILLTLFFLHIYTGFWIDDDATLFAFVSRVDNSFSFFIDQKTIRSSGFSFTPLQMFSYRIDFLLGGTNPFIAYIHNGLSFLAASLLFYSLLSRWWSVVTALTATLFWMLLPSTIAVLEFIGARHYMEGLVCTFLAALLAFKNVESKEVGRRFLSGGGALICLFLAMLCKEIYVTAAFAILVMIFFYYKRFWEIFSVFLLGGCYVLYRFLTIGLMNKYPVHEMAIGDYFHFLSKLPYIFIGNYLGYAVCLLFVVGFFFRDLSENRVKQRTFYIWFCLAFVLFVSLATIYPGTYYLSRSWLNKTTWYRLPFFVNLVFLIIGVVLFSQTQKYLRHVTVFVCAIGLMYGATTSRKQWDSYKDRYEKTGKFYIENPDKVVYSELPAYWYLGGIKSFYGLSQPYIISFHPDRFQYGKSAATELWRYRDGNMVADVKLWTDLKKKFH